MSEMQKAYAQLAESYNQQNLIIKKTTARTFENWDSNISIKSDFSRSDFEYFRSSGIPKTKEEILSTADECYKRVGIVKSVIDLMSDFATQGIRLQHPNKKIEAFYIRWFEKVKGHERSERFLNYLYRLGNVVIDRKWGTITLKQERELQKVYAEDASSFTINKPAKRNIPINYYFLNPAKIKALDPEVSIFSGKRRYAIEIDDATKKSIIRSVDRKTDTVPDFIINSLRKGESQVPIKMDDILTFFYKKDDWEYWANPITYSIFDSLIMLERMQLADLAALDGAISNIRLWTVGVLDGPNSILPTPEIMDKLKAILANNNGCGTLDLVWGPELTFTESKTEVHKFLGSEKYKITLDLIYDGLGIANALRSGTNAQGSANFISLKTLIERLNYGRKILLDFWNHEIELVQKAMGFKLPAIVVFDQMIMADEAAEKALLLQLLDRNIVSEEAIRERFNFNNTIEDVRVKQEERARKSNKKPSKASPYHNPDKEHDYKKAMVSSGAYAPSEFGIELEQKRGGEKTPAQVNQQYKPKIAGGRPKNVTETKKRKPKPKDKQLRGTKGMASLASWANEAQEVISNIITKPFLKGKNKKNVRSLTAEDKKDLETAKAYVLFSSKPYEQLDLEKVYAYLKTDNNFEEEFAEIQRSVATFVESNNRQPTIDEVRNIQSMIYAMTKGE